MKYSYPNRYKKEILQRYTDGNLEATTAVTEDQAETPAVTPEIIVHKTVVSCVNSTTPLASGSSIPRTVSQMIPSTSRYTADGRNGEQKNKEMPSKGNHHCLECGYTSESQTDVMYHRSEHMGIYFCRHCNCDFKTNEPNILFKHTLRHANRIPKKLWKKEFYCECREECCRWKK